MSEERARPTVVLMCNPKVGRSVLFMNLIGRCVTVSSSPVTTVVTSRAHAWALVAVLAVGGCAVERAAELQAGKIGDTVEPTETLAATPRLLELGKTTFERQCVACHGALGDGQGEGSYLLYPKPRDLTRGEYRLVSTWEGIPSDQDLFRTLSRGMPGSAMPSWAHLPEETRWGLVHYVKSLSQRPLDIPPAAEPARQFQPGQGAIQVPPEPPFDDPARARAQEVFAKGCAPCHGATGRGDGGQKQVDSKGMPTRPRDLTAGVYKGSPEPAEVYRRIVGGLPGSPMPSSPYLHGDDGWALAHYVLSLSSPVERERVEMKRFRIVAARVERLPEHPDAGAWTAVEPVTLHLMPLWWRPQRPEEITVRAVHDGKELAILLVWSDDSWDHEVVRPQDFRDAAAIQFALEPDPPFFAMGERGAPVNIWMWKSERQADIEYAFQDIDNTYPSIGIDSYPNFLRSPVEQPTRHALTVESDPTYLTAWGAGNIVADPIPGRAVEDLRAEGFGTLRARHGIATDVGTTGVHSTGSYRVLYRRPFTAEGPDAIDFTPRAVVPVAFAVWNGSAGDRDGKKSVSIWQELVIAP
jgi:mono/diheme cytochrome c family protein